MPWTEAGFILAAYLYGSLPCVWAAARVRGVDLRRMGSGSVSGSNLWQSAGALAGLAGFGDFTKGIVVVLVGRLLGFDIAILCLGGLAAVVGQCWPIFLRFSGGRGGSVSCGLGLILSPLEFGVAIIPFISAFLWRNIPLLLRRHQPLKERLDLRGAPTNIVPLGMLLSFALLPLFTWLNQQPQVITLAFSTLLLLLVIRRLTANLKEDIKLSKGGEEFVIILKNRLLYDRGYSHDSEL